MTNLNLILKAEPMVKLAALVAAALSAIVIILLGGMTVDPFFGLRWLSDFLTKYTNQDMMLSIIITLQVAKYILIYLLANRVVIITRNINRAIKPVKRLKK